MYENPEVPQVLFHMEIRLNHNQFKIYLNIDKYLTSGVKVFI